MIVFLAQILEQGVSSHFCLDLDAEDDNWIHFKSKRQPCKTVGLTLHFKQINNLF